MKNTLIQILILLIIITFLFLISEFSGINKLLLPDPLNVIGSLAFEFYEDNLLIDLLATTKRILIGFSLGTLLGIPLGIIIGYYKKIQKITNFWIDFLRSIPAPTLIPIFLLLLGMGDQSKILLTTFVVSLIILVNTACGVKNANPTRIMTGKSMGLNKRRILLSILLPEILPYISAGIRIALSFSIVAVIMSEMLMSTKHGLGRRIIDYQLIYETNKMYAVIILTGILGYLINKAYVIFENKKIHWAGK
jgi:NitT/TauT family transport system permease protein